MYALIDFNKVRSIRSERFYETIPDGRAIVPISDLRAFGTLENVDIIATAAELKLLIEEQIKAGIKPPEESIPEDVMPETDDTITEQSPQEEEIPLPDINLLPMDNPTVIPLTEESKKGGKE